MEKFEYQAVIKYLFFKKKTNDEIKAKLAEVYGDSVPLLSTINIAQLNSNAAVQGFFAEKRPGRPIEVITSEMIEKIPIL